jgi:hypothetical protein
MSISPSSVSAGTANTPSLEEPQTRASLISTVSQLLILYGVYVFISGWAFLDYYFRYYGIDPRWLDIGSYDILIKGFTALFTGGGWLWPLYILLIVIPVIAEFEVRRATLSVLLVSGALIVILLGVYWVSRNAGEAMAKKDKGDQSTLASITFRDKAENVQYHGKLVLFRSGTYFVHDAEPIPNPKTGITSYGSNIEVSVFRAEDITDIRIAEHQ